MYILITVSYFWYTWKYLFISVGIDDINFACLWRNVLLLNYCFHFTICVIKFQIITPFSEKMRLMTSLKGFPHILTKQKLTHQKESLKLPGPKLVLLQEMHQTRTGVWYTTMFNTTGLTMTHTSVGNSGGSSFHLSLLVQAFCFRPHIKRGHFTGIMILHAHKMMPMSVT